MAFSTRRGTSEGIQSLRDSTGRLRPIVQSRTSQPAVEGSDCTSYLIDYALTEQHTSHTRREDHRFHLAPEAPFSGLRVDPYLPLNSISNKSVSASERKVGQNPRGTRHDHPGLPAPLYYPLPDSRHTGCVTLRSRSQTGCNEYNEIYLFTETCSVAA